MTKAELRLFEEILHKIELTVIRARDHGDDASFIPMNDLGNELYWARKEIEEQLIKAQS